MTREALAAWVTSMVPRLRQHERELRARAASAPHDFQRLRLLTAAEKIAADVAYAEQFAEEVAS